MAEQGCPFEGHDHRFNPFGLTCWLQNKLVGLWDWMPAAENIPNFTVGLIPPYASFNFPLFWEEPREIPHTSKPVVRVFNFRFGWPGVLVAVFGGNWPPWLFWPLLILGLLFCFQRDMNAGIYLWRLRWGLEPRSMGTTR